MDQHGLPWYIQYELARGVSTGAWTWADVTFKKLKEMQASMPTSGQRAERPDFVSLQLQLVKMMGKQISGLKPEIW